MGLAAHLILTLFLLSLMTLVIIVIHEAGHLIAGILAGFHWESMKVGPFQFTKEQKKRWRLSVSEGYIHGYVKMMPVDRPGTRRHWVAILLAGSAANLLLCLVICLFLLTQTISHQQALGWLGFTAFSSGFTGVMNLLPFRFRRMSSDGLQLWRLCIRPKGFQEYEAEWERWKEQHNKAEHYRIAVTRYETATALGNSLKEGKRPRDWDAPLIAQGTTLRDWRTERGGRGALRLSVGGRQG